MNKFIRSVPLLVSCCVFATSLTACSETNAADVLNLGNSRVILYQGLSFDQDSLILTAPGRVKAYVNAAGDLRIGNKPIATTAAQHDLLKSYYAEAESANKAIDAVSKNAAAYGEQVANKLLGNLVDAHAKPKTDKNARGELNAASSRLCSEMQQLDATQKQIQASAPALQPYAAFRGEVDCGSSAADNSVARN